MHIHLTKKPSAPKHKKDGRINPHRFWIFFMTAFVLVLTIEIIWFTYFFVTSSKRLDAPVAPELSTNGGQIRKIEDSLKKIEDAVSTRIGN
jgi:preprotein translocase subunit SecY